MPASRLAKLTRPRTEGLLRRNRLFDLLDGSRARPVVWVSAPPGAGKTSLAASWLEDRRLPHVWYQVDANDADPATLFHYLREATEDTRAAKAKPLPPFRPEHLTDLPAFARLYFRGLFARLSGGVLVLDNFQEAPDASLLHTVFEAGFDEIPEGVTALIISRAAPPPAFARLRAGQRISLIDWDAIRLTRDEIAQIAAETAEALPDDTVQSLFEHTNGWAAGLVLMLERLRQTGQIKHLADSENLETVFDYFAGQVFNAAPAAHRDMLIRMSYLPRMTVELAQAITGDAEAGKLLGHLAKRNLFTDRRLGEDASYQFHALFRVFLQERARHDFGYDEHRKLTNSAAALLQATGQVEDAFALYMSAGEWDSATRLILKEADRLVRQGRRQTLRHWIQALPMDRFEADPWLSYWLAVSLLGTDYRSASQHLERAYLRFETSQDWRGCTLTASRVLDLGFAVSPLGLELERWTERIERLLDEPGRDQSDALVHGEGLVRLLQHMTSLRPYTAVTHRLAQRLEALLDRYDDDDLRVMAISRLMIYHGLCGNRVPVEAFYRMSVGLVEAGRLTTAATLSWYQPAMLHQLWVGDIDKATRIAEAAKVLVDDSGCVPDILEFDRLLAFAISMVRGVEEADRYMRERVVPQLAKASQLTRTYTPLMLANFALAMGNPAAALESSLEGLAVARLNGERSMGYRHLATVHAAALAAVGRFDEAWTWLDRITCDTDAGYNEEVWAWRRQSEIDLLLRQGRRIDALPLIRTHIRQRMQGGYTRTAWSSSRINASLYAEALESGIEPEFSRRMIRDWRYTPPPDAGPSWPWPLKVFAFGTFSIEGDAIVRKNSGRSATRILDLLKAIVAFGGHDVPCMFLADTVWPDADGAAAMRSLDVSLFRLRKHLGREDALLVRDGRVTLNSACCWVDARAFESLAESVDERADTDPALDVTLRKAIALYRGHLLAGEGEHPALLANRERLRVRWLSLVRRAVAREMSRADWAAVASLCRDALAIEPTAEDLIRHLIQSLDRQGARAEALAAYRTGVEQLRLSLGTRPSPETESLVRSIEGR